MKYFSTILFVLVFARFGQSPLAKQSRFKIFSGLPQSLKLLRSDVLGTIFIISLLISNIAIAKELSKTVAVIQLDKSTINEANLKGIKDALKDEKVKIVVKSAEGDQQKLIEIINSFYLSKPDVMVSVGFLVSKQMLELRPSFETPLVLSGIPDAIGLGLVTNLKKPGNNLTGTTDYPNVEYLISIMRKIMDLEHIAVIYNPNEIDSILIL